MIKAFINKYLYIESEKLYSNKMFPIGTILFKFCKNEFFKKLESVRVSKKPNIIIKKLNNEFYAIALNTIYKNDEILKSPNHFSKNYN